MIHQDGGRDIASIRTVSAQWLRRKDNVPISTPTLVVSTLSPMRFIIWQSVPHPPAALTKRTSAHLGDILSPLTHPNYASPPKAWPPEDRRLQA